MADTLESFELSDLEQFTYKRGISSDTFHLMFVGKDDVHDALKHVLSRASKSIYCNMFGFDDDELNGILFEKCRDPHITMLITLDKSQAGGVHEKKLIEMDKKEDLASFNTHFVIGQSATHQISHTKGFVADGIVGAEGSTNWSASGEGIFIVKGQAGGKGYKAQNNTQTFFTAPNAVAAFEAELIAEHLAAQKAQ